MADQLIDRYDLGAWLVKVDPKTWDLPAWMADGNDAIQAWSVADDDRGQLMERGDKVIFWVSGDSKVMSRGIWGLGYVTGELHDALPLGPDDDLGYWLDLAAATAETNEVPVYIPILAVPVSDQDLRADGIDDLEIQQSPEVSNPSWVSSSQLARIEELLLGWPDLPDPIEEITVARHGAGLGDAYTHDLIHDAALEAVDVVYSGEGWTLEDVSADALGWALRATHPSGEELKIAVKGVSGDKPKVLLTATEIKAARGETSWILVVVTRAISKPETWEFTADEAMNAAKAYLFKADFTPEEPDDR